MSGIADNYDVYYADKLWTLLPAVYRVQDTDEFGATGPLRELVNRIGAQAAILRRSIDRMWDDQSIETCDDWVIPYIADLLDTQLVAGLDPRGQRLDVAKTIYYRRRKGTVAILEEIAADITGWDAKVVEFFRRLGRTRHGLDPPIGLAFSAADDVAVLQTAEGLVGARTRSPIGGFADLRDAHGARQAHTAFDEYFHYADMRAGQGRFGWHNIPHLGVFLWRLESFPVGPVTPVPVLGCPGWFTFDPTGRDVPLFAAARASNQFGDAWTSPVEGQLPGPISQALLDADLAAGADGLALYPSVMSVASEFFSPPDQVVLPASALLLRPARGRFATVGPLPPGNGPLVASYHYGFPSEIGAGPYDRRIGALAVATPAPAVSRAGGGGSLLLPPTGTLTIGDSLTYAGASGMPVLGALTLRADNRERPLIRFAPDAAPLVLTGTAGSCLTLDGLFFSGQDIVLRGTFDRVTLSCCTLDPGSAASTAAVADALASPPGSVFAVAADGQALSATRLWIEATVGELTADRCVLGPLRTRSGGTVGTLAVSNSVVQGIRTSGPGPLVVADVKDTQRLERRLQAGLDPVAAYLRALSPALAALLDGTGSPPQPLDLDALLVLINELVVGPPLYDAVTFAHVALSATTRELLTEADPHAPAPELNRLLLEDAFPLELADAALAFGDGVANLSRCTVLGRVIVHRLEASECILQELTEVDDIQDGCVRFTAWADGSVLPRQYESVRIPQTAPLFTSSDFGQPGYAQLLPMADAQILPPHVPSTAPVNTISAGAEDGSEMGVYAREKNPLKQRALLLKFQEYMPAGLVPVVIDVT
jgi:hypothetical protein